MAELRSRALIFLQYFEPMLIVCKSEKLGEDRKSRPHYLDQGRYIRAALKYANKLQTNPRLIFDRSIKLFPFDEAVCASMSRYLNNKQNKPMVDFLYEDRPEEDDIIIPLARAYGVELKNRLLSGTTSKFLGVADGAEKDGCFLNPTPEMYEQMKTMPWTTDLIEGEYGKVDNFLNTNSPNVELLAAGAITCFLANNMAEFLQLLVCVWCDLLLVLVLSRRRFNTYARNTHAKEHSQCMVHI